MLVCGDPSCGVEMLDGQPATEKFFLDPSTGRVLSLVRHDRCAARYAGNGNLQIASLEDRKTLLSPASAMRNMLNARRRAKRAVAKA